MPIKETDDIIDMEVDYFKEVPEHFDGLLDDIFRKKFKRAFTCEPAVKFSKSPRHIPTESMSSSEKKERKSSHSEPMMTPIEKPVLKHESNINNKS